MPTTVAVITADVSFGAGLERALSADADFAPVGYAAGVREACSLLETARPDLAVSDLLLPDGDAARLLRELQRRKLNTRVVVLSETAPVDFLRDALEAGAAGFVWKCEPLPTLLAALRQVGGGPVTFALALQQRLHQSSSDWRLARLSGREREVWALLMRGRSTREIADVLCVCVKTVESHRKHIKRKLGFSTSKQIERLADAQGLRGT